MRQLFYYKIRQRFITKCVRFFLQNATFLLQNATVITNHDDFITKCASYYKMRRLLQIATVRTLIQLYFGNNLIFKTIIINFSNSST